MKPSRIDNVKDYYNGQAIQQENWDKATVIVDNDYPEKITLKEAGY
jgi:hypothetical protein